MIQVHENIHTVSNSRRCMELLELEELPADDNRYLHEKLLRISGYEIIGADFGLKEVMGKVRSVASLISPVLLPGEPGMGKEIIAGAIHNASPRRDGTFIKVNCGAIPAKIFSHNRTALVVFPRTPSKSGSHAMTQKPRFIGILR